MSFLALLFSHLETLMLRLALTMSNLETETLYNPPSLRFFTAGGDTDELFRQAFMFALAPFHAFITMPLLDSFLGPQSPLSRCPLVLRFWGWWPGFSLMFWLTVFVMSGMVLRGWSGLTDFVVEPSLLMMVCFAA